MSAVFKAPKPPIEKPALFGKAENFTGSANDLKSLALRVKEADGVQPGIVIDSMQLHAVK